MKRHISYPLTLAGMTLLAASSLSCAAGETFDKPTPATLAEDSRIMAKIFETRADKARKPFMQIDLTDERQYNFVRNRLLASGSTPENAPHLFELLKQQRQGDVGSEASAVTSEVPDVQNSVGQPASAASQSWCGHFLLLEERVSTYWQNTIFLPTVLMSCFDGASYAYLDGAAYRTDDVQGTIYTPLAQDFNEQYNNGRNVELKLGRTDTDAAPGEHVVEFGALDNYQKTLVLDSLAIAEKNGVQHFTYATVQTMGPGGATIQALPQGTKTYVNVPSIKIDHPTKVINSTNDPLWFDFFCGTNVYGKNPRANSSTPWRDPYRAWPDYEEYINYNCAFKPPNSSSPPPVPPPAVTDRVRICLERGFASYLHGQYDCDYATVQQVGNELLPFKYPYTGIAATSLALSNQAAGALRMDKNAYWPASPKYDLNKRYVPVKGTYELNYPGSCTIDSFDPAFTQAQLVLYEDGGYCWAVNNGDTAGTGLAGALTTNATGTTASFDMLGSFGELNGQTFAPGCFETQANSKRSHFYVIIRAKTTGSGPDACSDRYATARVTPVDFLKTCFAEGTEIRRADGKLMPIEQFKVGEKVIANNNGLLLTVTGVVVGGESKPLVNLYDDQGHDLFVTEMHPVVTVHRGIVKAVELAEGDEVMTENGPAKLTSVQRVGYDRQVYNLALGTPEELVRAGKENRTMFAEGYLVGDNEMQFELDSAPKQPPDRIASAWQRDYEQDVKRGHVKAR